MYDFSFLKISLSNMKILGKMDFEMVSFVLEINSCLHSFLTKKIGLNLGPQPRFALQYLIRLIQLIHPVASSLLASSNFMESHL